MKPWLSAPQPSSASREANYPLKAELAYFERGN
jgi:hypothetical protein